MTALIPLFVRGGDHPLGQRHPELAGTQGTGIVTTGPTAGSDPGSSPVFLIMPIRGRGSSNGVEAA